MHWTWSLVCHQLGRLVNTNITERITQYIVGWLTAYRRKSNLSFCNTVLWALDLMCLCLRAVDCDLCRRHYKDIRHCPKHSADDVMQYYMASLLRFKSVKCPFGLKLTWECAWCNWSLFHCNCIWYWKLISRRQRLCTEYKCHKLNVYVGVRHSFAAQ